MAVLHENGDYEYVDNDDSEIIVPTKEVTEEETKKEPKKMKLDEVE